MRKLDSHLAESRDQGCPTLRASFPLGTCCIAPLRYHPQDTDVNLTHQVDSGFPQFACTHLCVCLCGCVCVFSSMQVHHVKVRVATITVKTFTVPSPHGPVLSAFQATLTLFLQPSYSSGLATGYVSTVSKFGHFSFKSDAPASIPKCYIDGCTQYATFQD